MKPSLLRAAALGAALAASVASTSASEAQRWIGTWHASPQPLWQSDFPFPTHVPFNLWNQTVRQVVRIGPGGKRFRVVLSNEYGSQPLHIGAAHLALSNEGADILAASDRVLRFGGRESVTIPAGAPMLSDPVELAAPASARLSISLYLPQPATPSTFHWEGLQSTYLSDGDATAALHLGTPVALPVRLFLTGVQVEADADARAVVVLGDSISDGAASTPGSDRRWPDFLARRLAGERIAVLNAGISGARVLRDRMGANALARFDRDVLGQPQLRTVIVLIGINDISWHGTPFAPDDAPVGADELIAGYRQLIVRAHARGIRMVGATLTPFEGALPDTPITGYYTAEKERVRQDVNRWIRQAGEFDAIIDFDALLRDPERPGRMLPAYDSGDHLHPGDAGYQAMAEAVDPALL
ncbi:MAG: SGNH/GDSL hydrolase family protein [Pseudoxanthomonas sp.]